MENLVKNRPRRSGYFPNKALGQSYSLDPNKLAHNAKPTTQVEAIADVRDSGLFSDYDGYVGQVELIEDEARQRWPELFDVPPSKHTDRLPETANTVSDFFDAHRKENGKVDWDSVARATTYVVSRSVDYPERLAVVQSLPQQLEELASVDVSVRVG